jgi:hypothetical protein
MPRSSTYDPPCTFHFQTTERTRDALHALARRQERSASALVRIAVRNLLAGQPSLSEQQHGDQEPSATSIERSGR